MKPGEMSEVSQRNGAVVAIVRPSGQSDSQSVSKDGDGRWRTSLSGYKFDIDADIWKIDAGASINAAWLKSKMSGPLAEGCLLTLAATAEKLSTSSTEQANAGLRDFLRFAASAEPLTNISTTTLMNFRAHVVGRDVFEDNVVKLRSFFKRWNALRHAGISDEVVALLTGWRLKTKPPGRNVASLDPEKGPLEPTELHALAASVRSAYEQELIDHAHFAVSLVLIYTGRRPTQVAYMKCLDLDDGRNRAPGDVGQGPGDQKMFIVHIPRAKQHGASFRESFRSVEVIEAFWMTLALQRAQVVKQFDELLAEVDWDLQSTDIEHLHGLLPLFPAWKKIRPEVRRLRELARAGSHGDAIELLRKAADSKAWHPDSPRIDAMLDVAVHAGDARARDGRALQLTPTRLRYTKGTDAARDGHGRAVIAWLLDQSELRTVDVYVKNLPEHAIPINKAMAKSALLKQVAQLFRGKVVDTESDAIGGDEPGVSRILFNGKATATCGNRMQCGMGRLPIPCYTCDHFQPWLDGPHEQVLDELLRKRQERYDALGPDQKTMIEASDPTIVAVIQVIQRCEHRRAQLAAGLGIEVTEDKSGGEHKQ